MLQLRQIPRSRQLVILLREDTTATFAPESRNIYPICSGVSVGYSGTSVPPIASTAKSVTAHSQRFSEHDRHPIALRHTPPTKHIRQRPHPAIQIIRSNRLPRPIRTLPQASPQNRHAPSPSQEHHSPFQVKHASLHVEFAARALLQQSVSIHIYLRILATRTFTTWPHQQALSGRL